MCIIEFLNDYNGALMVIISAIYVIATIIICNANAVSAKATREQLEESKRQFRETQRLEVMPYLQLEEYESATIMYSLNLVLVSGDLGVGTYILKARLKNVIIVISQPAPRYSTDYGTFEVIE